MQHAVGSPLPPPHQPGQGPHAGWASAAHHPGAPQGPAPVPRRHPASRGRTWIRTSRTPVGPMPPAPPQRAPPRRPRHDRSRTAAARWPGRCPHRTAGRGRGPDPTATTLAVLLIGPAGAGKTSVAKYWADHRRVPTAHISLDDVREWVRAGYANPQSGWNDNSEAQYRLARRTCGFAARNFLANGISCILDDAVFPDRPVVGLGGWKRHVGPGLLPVVLLPGLDIVLERNAERSGNRRLTDEEVARIHGRMAGWYGSGLPIIDNSQLDVPGTARVLDDVLARAIASPPSW
ncbi:Pro-rich N-terminal domain-containing protein [Streptomyces diastatochromogenes]|nr:Pro-rich N-terminal domain-containing protein [Streptomyces diastatochromogenes]